MVKIVKLAWATGVWVCTHSGIGENSENGENGENSDNGMKCYGVGCVSRIKMVKIVKMEWGAGVCVFPK